VQKLRTSGLAVSFSGLTEDALRILTKNHVTPILGPENLYVTHGRAIASLYASAHSGSSESDCPLQKIAPHLTELSLHDSGTLRSAENHRLRLCRHIGVLRFGGPFVLANRKAIQSEFIQWAKTRPEVRSVVFDASTIDSLDEVESDALLALVEGVREAGYRLAFGGFTDRAFETIARNGVADTIGHDHIYASGLQAVAGVFSDSHADDPDEDCALAGVLPRLIELSRTDDGALRDARRHGLALCQRIAVVRFDGPLNVATVGHFEKELRGVLERRPDARYVLIGGHTFSDLDRIAAEELPHILERLERDGYRVIISGLKDEHLDILRTGEGTEFFGRERVAPTLDMGIFTIYYEAHRDWNEGSCPLVAATSAP
jgi:MFS superfamily sulfate permease-like transporter